MGMKMALAATIAVGTAFTPNMALAKSPSDLGDLVGVRGSSLDNVMEGRGYALARTQGAQYWWNGSSQVCAAVSIANGRVSQVRTATAQECGKSADAAAKQPALDCNAPDLSEADRYRCPAGGSADGAQGGRAAAIKACTDAFGPNATMGPVSALREGFWEVILSDNYGRKVSCTGTSNGRVEQWDELGKK